MHFLVITFVLSTAVVAVFASPAVRCHRLSIPSILHNFNITIMPLLNQLHELCTHTHFYQLSNDGAGHVNAHNVTMAVLEPIVENHGIHSSEVLFYNHGSRPIT